MKLDTYSMAAMMYFITYAPCILLMSCDTLAQTSPSTSTTSARRFSDITSNMTSGSISNHLSNEGNHSSERFGSDALLAQATCDPKTGAMLIASCPNLTNEGDKNLCQSDNLDPAVDIIFPVTDSVSGNHFRNFYCWRCFNQSGEPLRWTAETTMTSWNKIETTKDNMTLRQVLNFMDANPALTKWRPPASLPFPICTDDGHGYTDRNCTISTDESLSSAPGCSFITRTIDNMGKAVHWFACSAHATKHSVQERRLECEDLHYSEIALTSSLFVSEISTRSDILHIKVVKREELRLPWRSRECSTETGLCPVTSCRQNILEIRGKCDSSYTPYVQRIKLCFVLSFEFPPRCVREITEDMLNTEYNGVKSPELMNTTRSVRSLNKAASVSVMDEQDSLIDEAVSKGSESDLNEDATMLRDIIVKNIDMVVPLYITNYNVTQSLEEDNDGSLDLGITGWINTRHNSFSWSFERDIRASVLTTLVNIGVRGKILLCSRNVRKFNELPDLRLETDCQPITLCSLP